MNYPKRKIEANPLINRNKTTLSYEVSKEPSHGFISPLLSHVTKPAKGGLTGDTHGKVPACDDVGNTAHGMEGDNIGTFPAEGDGNMAKAGNVNLKSTPGRNYTSLHKNPLPHPSADRCPGGDTPL